MNEQNTTACKCGGTGKITTEVAHESGTAITTHLCQCRIDLPRRHGKVFSWATARPVSWEFESVAGWLKCTVIAQQELPISDDGYPLHRTEGNSYYNTGATIEIDGEALTSEYLRCLAKFLTECADKIDKMDEPIAEPEPAHVA